MEDYLRGKEMATVAFEHVTPELAKRYLELNKSNRDFRRSVGEAYLRDLKAGNWQLTHQGIAFDEDGNLIDGQHRLWAIVESGIACDMVVARGLPKKSQIAMDDHAKRSASDSIGLSFGIEIGRDDIAVLRCVDAYAPGSKRGHGKTKSELKDMFIEMQNGVQFVNGIFEKNERGVTAAVVKAAVCLAWFYVNDVNRLTTFARILTGKDIPENEQDRAPLLLREWCLRTGVRYGGVRIEAFGKTQRAIAAFMEHKNLGKLYADNTYFPFPLVEPVRK